MRQEFSNGLLVIRNSKQLVASLFPMLLVTTGSYAQFTTVINLPPDAVPNPLEPNTQVNVLDGGMFSGTITSNSSSEVNILGGVIDSGGTFRGGDLFISGGVIGNHLLAESVDTLAVSGGVIGDEIRVLTTGRLIVSGGAIGDFADFLGVMTIEFKGGTIGSNVFLHPLHPVSITGGAFAHGFTAVRDLSGSDFELDGNPILGLDNVGDTTTLSHIPRGVLTGIFSDGTPFRFEGGNGSGDRYSNSFDDFTGGFFDGIVLRRTAVPALVPFRTVSAAMSPILGVRDGEELQVDAALGNQFRAGRGSRVSVVDGGSIGENFQTMSARVSITGGTIGDGFESFGESILDIDGATIGSLQVREKSIVHLRDSSIGGYFSVDDDSVANISGSTVVDSLFVYGDGSQSGGLSAVANISGGALGNVDVGFSGTVNISGGTVDALTQTKTGRAAPAYANISGGSVGIPGSFYSANFIGTEFFIDGQPIQGLLPGVPFEINVETGLFSGTLVDGMTFSHELFNADLSGPRFGTLAVTLVPEPSVSLLLCVSGLVLAAGSRWSHAAY